jgi:hypothetical protein
MSAMGDWRLLADATAKPEEGRLYRCSARSRPRLPSAHAGLSPRSYTQTGFDQARARSVSSNVRDCVPFPRGKPPVLRKAARGSRREKPAPGRASRGVVPAARPMCAQRGALSLAPAARGLFPLPSADAFSRTNHRVPLLPQHTSRPIQTLPSSKQRRVTLPVRSRGGSRATQPRPSRANTSRHLATPHCWTRSPACSREVTADLPTAPVLGRAIGRTGPPG